SDVCSSDLDNNPVSCKLLGRLFQLDGKRLQEQYIRHLSGFMSWDQLEHAEDWVLFPENIGEYLSLDEVCLSQGELYTVLTNKEAKGKKGALLAMVKGTVSEKVYINTRADAHSNSQKGKGSYSRSGPNDGKNCPSHISLCQVGV